MGRTLTNEQCIKNDVGTPDGLNMYADDVCGAGAIVRGVGDLLAGQVVSFAVCKRDPGHAVPEIMNIVTVAAMPDRACVRYCGEGGRPDGAGSSTVHGCGSVYAKGTVADLDPLRIVAALSFNLTCKGKWIFRLAATEATS